MSYDEVVHSIGLRSVAVCLTSVSGHFAETIIELGFLDSGPAFSTMFIFRVRVRIRARVITVCDVMLECAQLHACRTDLEPIQANNLATTLYILIESKFQLNFRPAARRHMSRPILKH